jgi:uncharacterized protein YabE (DUF348 family)
MNRYHVTLKIDGRKMTVVTHASTAAHAQDLTLGYFELQGVAHGEVVSIIRK